MSGWQIAAAVFCVMAAGAAVFWNWRKTRNILENIERMLDSGINGTFTETTFDESRLSALESKFAQYLSASEVSARNLAAQKDKIKTMIADISHQTKTPVANLLLYSELLQEEELPESAKASAEAVSNVVENAIKYTEQGGIAITVISYEMFVRIDVADTGIGIPEDMQEKIFSRFYRSEAVREQEGVGIGLYLAREILDGENGYIKVSSWPGEGSDFSIFLPVDGKVN